MKQPNILLIIADDHGSWATGCYGNSKVRTPNLDYLAASGVQCMNAFTPCPVCSPARASLFTGRIPSQHGVHDFLAEDPTFSDYPWLANERFLPEYLQRQGYQTALIGKWHCTADSHNVQPGFDYWISYDVRARGWQNQYEHVGAIDFSRQGERITTTGFQSQFLTEEAINFVRQRDVQRPFFLTLSLVDTHFPFTGQPQRFVESYRRAEGTGRDIPTNEEPHLEPVYPLPSDHHERIANHYAGVSMIDHQVGTLLDSLEGAGLLTNTLVIYTADHGHMLGHHGLYGKGNATVPQNFYEESIRIPLLLRWPLGNIAQAPITEPVDLCDLFATIVDAGNASLSAQETTRLNALLNSPGQSLLPLLRGEIKTWRTYQWCEYGNARMITDLRHKLVRRYPPHNEFPDEFFDLQTAPRETDNLIDSPDSQPVIQKFQRELDDFYQRYTEDQADGTRVFDLPRHNRFEPWRRSN